MLTPVQSLLDVQFAPSVQALRESVELFLTSIESVTFDQFAYLNAHMEVEKLAICYVDDDVVSVVIQGGLNKASIKSLALHYTQAKSVRVYYSDFDDFPKGDDWSVEGLTFLMDNPPFDESLPPFEVERDDVYVSIVCGEKKIMGTYLEDLNSYSVLVMGDYEPKMVEDIKLVQAFANGQGCRLLVQALDNSWIKPMFDMGFSANRWILKADFAHL